MTSPSGTMTTEPGGPALRKEPGGPALTLRHQARRSATDAKIADGVLAVLRDEGPKAVTIEAVAARSGVAKTTIYRRYEDRAAMVQGVLELLEPVAPEEVEVSRQGLEDLLCAMQRAFQELIGPRTIAIFLTSDDELISAWRTRVLEPHTNALRMFLTRGVEEGVLAADLDVQIVHELILGGMFMSETLVGKVPQEWAARVVETLWPVLRRPTNA